MMIERAQRPMITDIKASIPTHVNGIWCWGAFRDASNIPCRFTATGSSVVSYATMFVNAETFCT
eukprot:7094133-Pyramimonas_sp.AAC.1